MSNLAIVNSFGNVANKAVCQLQKHSPQILIGVGIVGTVVSAIMACKATTKAGAVLEEAKTNVDAIHECQSNTELVESGEYTDEDAKKDMAITYVQTGVKLFKLYAPSVSLGVLSLISILASNNILHKRNVALAAAYTTLDNSFKKYRNNVIERFGEAVDKELKYNLKKKKVDEVVVDPETGKENKVKKEAFVVNPSDISGYARFFEKYTTDEEGNSILNQNWQNDNEMNLMFLKAQEKYANDILRSKKRLFLNDVYKMLGLPTTKAGQVVGWVYDPENPIGDNYVDFGIYQDNLSFSDFVNGYDNAILLDFNVDGNIWELMS